MGDVTVASTSDTQEQVNAAAGGVAQDEPPAEPKAPPTGDQQVESGEPEKKEAAAADPEKQEEKLPVPKSIGKKFDKLYKEKKELEERLAALEAKQTKEPEPEPTKVPMEVAAKFDTFDEWSQKQIEAGKPAEVSDYLDVRDAWKDARRAQQEEKEAFEAEVAATETTYQEKVDAFKAEHDDWDEVVGQELDIPPILGPAVKKFDNGPEIVYYLGKNPQVLKKLNELEPLMIVAELGKLAVRLEKAAPQQAVGAAAGADRAPVVSSKAPPPIKALGGNSIRSTVDLNDPNITYEEYRRIRDQQEKARWKR